MIDILNKNKTNVSKSQDKKVAFTLAEVLITLTIIGVIAALTIPNLLQSYRKHQVEVGVKEAYSILSNAIKMLEADNGSTIEDIINEAYGQPGNQITAINYFCETYLNNYLKHTKTCEAGSSNCGVFPKICSNGNCGGNMYENRYIKMLDGSQPNNGFTNNGAMYEYALANGMYLGVSWYSYSELSNGFSFIYTVDINGDKGPNQIGHDIFHFGIMENKLYATGGLHLPSWKGIKNTDCKNTGEWCSAVIMKNGWKIPDEYPVKKW